MTGEVRRRLATHLLLLVALPLLAHAAFSALGFNPTDDGFILAASRRLLDGQVPHRDFISVRPVASSVLHAPWLVLGGDHAYLLGRLAVWFEFALIAWAWTRLALRLTGRPDRAGEVVLWTIASFVLTSFTFPIMPWHTVDAVAFVSLGLLLAASPGGAEKTTGYALLGAAALFRQNFLVVAPLAALLLGDHRRSSVGLAVLAPLAAYAAWLGATGALGPALGQVQSQTGLREVGLLAYARNEWAGIGLAAGIATSLLATHARTAPIARGLGWGFLLGAAFLMTRDLATYIRDASFGLFGAALGTWLVVAWRRGWSSPESRLGGLALLVAWSASISIGMNTPALAAAPLVAFLLAATAGPAAPAEGVATARSPWPGRIAGAAIAGALIFAWSSARLTHIYRERPAGELTHRLDGVLPGGAGIRASAGTTALLADLDRAIDLAHGRPFAIVGDCAGYWPKAAQQNPLSIDWPQVTELNTPALQARVFSDLEALRGRGVILVQEVHAGRIAERFDAIQPGDAYYVANEYVRKNFRRTGGTAWFAVYE